MPAFTWSYPAARAFELCRRKRYWRNYADSSERDQARILGRLISSQQLAEQAVVAAGKWLREQDRDTLTGQEAYEQAARPLLNDVWKSSRTKAWKQPSAIGTLGILEEVHAELHPDFGPNWPVTLKTQILEQIEHLLAHMQPLFDGVPRSADCVLGEKQQFEIDQVKIQVDPHWVYRENERIRIHRWECGLPDPADQYHMGLLVKWASAAYGVSPEEVDVIFEYLALRQSVTESDSAALLRAAEDWMQESWMDMSDYLENEDRLENRPRPKLEWDMTPDRDVCRNCCYHALCKPEW